MYVEVKNLSQNVQNALAGVSYGRKDIQVIPAERIEGTVAGGDGKRGFVVVVNLDTGKSKRVMGSWGGSNPWSDSPVDSGDSMIEIPDNGIVIKGTMGYPRTWAEIYAQPSTVGRFLPSGNDEELTDADQQALYCYKCIKGGAYRRDEMSRRNVTESTVDSLVERGYLKRSKNGATQITTKGRNASTVRY